MAFYLTFQVLSRDHHTFEHLTFHDTPQTTIRAHHYVRSRFIRTTFTILIRLRCDNIYVSNEAYINTNTMNYKDTKYLLELISRDLSKQGLDPIAEDIQTAVDNLDYAYMCDLIQ